jgi:predicted component of type VI protein secretion system
MGLTIKFQSTGLIPNNPDPIVMDGSSVTIGRGGSNSLALVDNERMISTNHCVIEDKSGEYVMLDISTNGTFLNYGKIPIGDNPTILSDGDIISIGPYELLIDLSEKNDADPMDFQNNSTTPAPFQGSSQPELDEIINVLDEPEQSGDFLTDLVGEGPKKTR